MNMYNWMERVIYGPKKPFPLLSYPCVQYLYVTVSRSWYAAALTRLSA